jgi:LysM repeat protein
MHSSTILSSFSALVAVVSAGPLTCGVYHPCEVTLKDGALRPTGEQALIAKPKTLLSEDETKYTVVAGDYVYKIAMKLGVDFEDMFTANPSIDPYSMELHEGQTLNVPPPSVPAVWASGSPPAIRDVTTRTIDFASQLRIISPASSSCANAPVAGECETASMAAPWIYKSFFDYSISSVYEIAAIVSLMAFETADFKYAKSHFPAPGVPGKGSKYSSIMFFMGQTLKPPSSLRSGSPKY